MIKNAFIFLFCLSVTTHLYAIEECEPLLTEVTTIEAYTGAEVANKFAFFRPHKTYYLGMGEKGGEIFRIVFTNGESFIIKKYFQRKTLLADYAKMKLLNRIKKVLPFDIAQYTLRNYALTNTVVIDDIEGVSVYKMIQNELGSHKDRVKIVDTYNSYILSLFDSFHHIRDRAVYKREINGHDLLQIKFKLPGLGEFFFHSDNFIFAVKKKKLILVDPY